MNLQSVEDLGHQEFIERYCTGRTDSLNPGRAGRICAARVA